MCLLPLRLQEAAGPGWAAPPFRDRIFPLKNARFVIPHAWCVDHRASATAEPLWSLSPMTRDALNQNSRNVVFCFVRLSLRVGSTDRRPAPRLPTLRPPPTTSAHRDRQSRHRHDAATDDDADCGVNDAATLRLGDFLRDPASSENHSLCLVHNEPYYVSRKRSLQCRELPPTFGIPTTFFSIENCERCCVLR